MGIPDHLTCLLRYLYAGQEATVRIRHGQRTVSKLGKEYVKAIYCHPAYLTYMQSISWETLDWKKHKLESRLPGEISITLDMQMTPPLWQKKAERQRIDAFEVWCWRRLLRVPWTTRRSNQSIVNEISPGISLEGLMLKGNSNTWPPHVKSWLIGKDPDAGRDWGQEEKGTTEDEMAGWHHWLDGHEFG